MGVGIGIIATSITPVFANIQEYLLTKVEYPIIVNSVEYTNNELPMLNYNGYTFVPLKAVGDMLNANVQWNEELRRVEIGEVKNNNSNTHIYSDELHEGFYKHVIYNDEMYYSAPYSYYLLKEYNYYLDYQDQEYIVFLIKQIGDTEKNIYEVSKDETLYIKDSGRTFIKSEVIESLIN